jgi:hypothetical protein
MSASRLFIGGSGVVAGERSRQPCHAGACESNLSAAAPVGDKEDHSMKTLILIAAAAPLSLGFLSDVAAQTTQRGQAASHGQSRADNRLPQPPSGGVPTGKSAAGPVTEQERHADQEAKKATEICKGC